MVAALVGSAEYSGRSPGWAAQVNWGDGTTSGGAVVGNEVGGSHVYQAFGSFPVAVTLSDDRGVSAVVSATADVEPPSNSFRLGTVSRLKARGTAIVPVSVPGPGTLLLSGKGIVTQSKAAVAAGTVRLLVTAKGSTERRLNRTGGAEVKVTVTFTPTDGLPNREARGLGLRKSAP